MYRTALAGAFSAFALVITPAHAADYFPDVPGEMRGGYNDNWDMSDYGDPLDFEFGMRYFYSIGSRQMTVGANSYDISDTGHALELHGRIDDHSTGTYLKGYAGLTGIMSGSANTPLTGGNVNLDSGQLGYLLGDFGYLGYGTGAFGFGPFVGYQYLNEQAQVTAANETVSTDVHMLRLGLAARADISDMIDLQAEVALVPYAFQGGSAGGGVNLDASLFGVTGEAMAGFHPTENLVIRAGGRAWYLTDSLQSGSANHTNLRYGALVELTYTF